MTTSRDPSDAESRVLAEFAVFVDRLLAGETIDVEAIAADHPEFGDELMAQLRAFQEMTDVGNADVDGMQLGDYTLQQQLGSGGMGVVHKAWQNSLHRHVALKLLPKVSTDAKTIARFIREAQISAKLQHQNVVTIFDMGVAHDTPYYTMELVLGRTLLEVLRDTGGDRYEDEYGEFGLRHCLDMATAFAGVAEGLAHAHGQGVIHRDIKPANLIFDPSRSSRELPRGTLRILDFGLAQFDGQESLTVSGALVGTVRYMSPEQAAARSQRIDHRSDIYSFGATLYEAITLQPPFSGDDLQATLSQIRFKEIPRPSQLNLRVPRDLETIVLKCMRKRPEDRFQSAEALAQDLHRFVRGDPIDARPLSPLEKLSRLAWKHRWSAATAAMLLLATCFAIWFGSKWRTTDRALRRTAYEPKIKEAISHLRCTERALYAQNPNELSIYPWGYVRFSPRDNEPYDCFVKDCSSQSLIRALSCLDDAIDSDPARPDAYWHRARVHVLLNNWRAAQSDLQDVMQRDPSHIAGLFLLASLERVHGDAGRARALFDRAQALARSGWQRHWLRGQRAAQSYRWADAEEEFNAVLNQAEGKGPYIGWDLEMRQAVQICMQLSENYVDSLMKLEVLLDEWPNALDLQVSHGTLKYAIPEQRMSGLEWLERLYRDNERDTAVAGEIAERVCLQHGLLVQTSREPFNRELADQWLARIPDPRTRAFIEYRMRLVQQNHDDPAMRNAHREEALKILKRASIDYPSNPWYLLTIAGKEWLTPEATACVEEAARRDPTCSYAQACLVFRRAYHSFRDPADGDKRRSAEEALRQAQACNVCHTWERIYLAYAIGLLGDLAEATRRFDELSQQDHFPWIEHNRGEMLYRLAMAPGVPPEERDSLLTQSLHAQNIAIERRRSRTFLPWKLRALAQLEDDAETTRFYREVIADGVPLDASVELSAGLACLNSGQHADAIDAFGRALQIHNGPTWLYNQLRDLLRHSARLVREPILKLLHAIQATTPRDRPNRAVRRAAR